MFRIQTSSDVERFLKCRHTDHTHAYTCIHLSTGVVSKSHILQKKWRNSKPLVRKTIQTVGTIPSINCNLTIYLNWVPA